MHHLNLGPHTFFSPSTHARRPDWLSRFKPQERRLLIEEDCHARMHVFGIMIGAMLFGLVTLVIALSAL